MKFYQGDWVGFYRRFFDSLNFDHWFAQKKQEAEKKLDELQLQLLCEFDVKKWIENKKEIEIIDQYLSAKQKLDAVIVENECTTTSELKKTRIKEILRTFLGAVPEDVRPLLEHTSR